MNEVLKNLYVLFDAAFEENMNGRGTDITRMVTTFVPDAIQNLQAYEDMESQGRLIVLSIEDIHPCRGCNTGWGYISSEGCKSCHDDCEKLEQYNKRYNA